MLLSRDSLPQTIYLLIATSGFATLSWEVIWQIKATLALGISAFGTAITLAVIMGGMSLGGFFMGNVFRNGSALKATRLYGLLEIIIGLSGLFLNTAFKNIEKIDSWAFINMPYGISLVYVLGIIAVLLVPTFCMGATLPLFGSISKALQVSIAKLYSLNTLGAASGILFVAFLLIQLFGVTYTIWIIGTINIVIGISAWLLIPNQFGFFTETSDTSSLVQPFSFKIIFIVFVTGFATFVLEVAWFRSFADVFQNTTDVFAIILACVLLALSFSAKKISILKQKKRLKMKKNKLFLRLLQKK